MGRIVFLKKGGVRVGRMLVMRSSGRVERNMRVCLRDRKCGIFRTTSNVRKLRILRGRRVRLTVVSVVVPHVSKVHVAVGLHRGCSFPMVVLSTGSRRISGVAKLGVKTSSCIAGPFAPVRLVTHIGSRLEHCHEFLRGLAPRRGMRIVKKLRVGRSAMRIAVSNGPIGLAPVRCGVLLLLTGGPKEIFSSRRVCREM